MRFVANRTITVAGFAADPNPNITAPTAFVHIDDRTGSNGSISVGIGLAAVFVKTSPPGTFEDDTAAATITFVLWFRDTTSNSWVRLTSDTATHRLYKVSADVRGASDVFVQVTAISSNPAAATSVNILVRET